MKHLHEDKDNQQEILQFAQEFVDLWLEKHRSLERTDLLEVLIELILNPNAKYYKLEPHERESWFTVAITLLTAEGLRDRAKVLIPPEAQIEALYRFTTGFDDSELCDDCKERLLEQIIHDVMSAMSKDIRRQERKERKQRWRNNRKKAKQQNEQQFGATECPSMTE